MIVCMPQFPLTTWLTEKSTPTVMAVITWSSVKLKAVIMKSLQWAQRSAQAWHFGRHFSGYNEDLQVKAVECIQTFNPADRLK